MNKIDPIKLRTSYVQSKVRQMKILAQLESEHCVNEIKEVKDGSHGGWSCPTDARTNLLHFAVLQALSL